MTPRDGLSCWAPCARGCERETHSAVTDRHAVTVPAEAEAFDGEARALRQELQRRGIRFELDDCGELRVAAGSRRLSREDLERIGVMRERLAALERRAAGRG